MNDFALENYVNDPPLKMRYARKLVANKGYWDQPILEHIAPDGLIILT